jgi:putative ABC transport system permease protein
LVWIFTLLPIGVPVGDGALSVANTLLMAAAYRGRDFRLLRLAGATPRQVMLTAAIEPTVVVAIGAVVGGGVAPLALWRSIPGLRAQMGTHVALTVPWTTVAVGACLPRPRVSHRQTEPRPSIYTGSRAPPLLPGESG